MESDPVVRGSPPANALCALSRGVTLLVADSGRSFFDAARFGLTKVMALDVAASVGVDGRASRTAVVSVDAPLAQGGRG